MKIIALLSSFLFTACVIGDEGAGQNGTDNDIIGGAVDTTDVAVGNLRAVTAWSPFYGPTSISSCTATLIAPTVMLTAAHCHQAAAIWNDVTFDTDISGNLFAPYGSRTTAQVIADPAYTGDSTQGHDVAVVILSRAVTDRAPIARGPVPTVGSYVLAVGYGLNVTESSGGPAQGLGTRRAGSLDVTAVNAHELAAGHEGDNVCHGDSGGPVLQNGLQVGVNSYVDTADCHGGGHFMRLDDNLDFIHLYAPNY